MKRALYAIVFILLGYILGCLIPLGFVRPIIRANTNTVTYFEATALWINGFLAFFTLCAVLTALFRDEISSLWRNVRFEIRPKSPDVLEEVLSDESGTPQASQYKVDLVVKNNGTIDAKNCIMRIGSITYINPQSDLKTPVIIEDNMLAHEGPEPNNITPEDHLIFNAFKIENVNREKDKIVGPDKPALFVGKNIIAPEYHAGKLWIEYIVSCDNKRPKKYFLEIHWDGKWKHRLADITKYLEATVHRKREELR